MNIITTTALSNFKKNKSKNILIGIAVLLTAFLLTVLPTVVMGQLDLQSAAVNKLYPSFHGLYRAVDEETAGNILSDERFEAAGLREDPGQIYSDKKDAAIDVMWADDTVLKLSKLNLSEGEFPEKADDIVVSEGLLKLLGIKGGIGDTVRLPFQQAKDGKLLRAVEKEFTITGMTEDTEESKKQGIYCVLVSEQFMQETVPEEERSYRVYFQLADTEGMVTEKLEERMQLIGDEYGIEEKDISENSAYLLANYVDAALYGGIAVVMLFVVLAGVLTIYSIYYVSMLDKVQEFGRLRAIGATKPQIKKLVFREGFAVAALAVPAGIIGGLLCGSLLLKFLVNSNLNVDSMLAEEMKTIMKSGEVHVVKGWIILLAAAVSFLTIYISLLRPMRKASRIPAMEAIRYQGEEKGGKKKIRKGYDELNIRRLAMTNLGRNKKRTAVTVVTLGMTGILFVTAVTFCNCIDADNIAREAIRKDIRVSLDAEDGNEMNPEQSLSFLQQNNPMTEELKGRIEAIDGVESVETCLGTYAAVESKNGDGEETEGEVRGLNSEILSELEKYLTEGSIKDPAFKEGKGIICSRLSLATWFPGYGVGDKIPMKITDGSEIRECEMEVVALVDAPPSLIGHYGAVPDSVLKEMCGADLTDTWDITVEKGRETAVAEEIGALIASEDCLKMETYQEYYEEGEKSIQFVLGGAYSLLFIFGLIGILNLVNTIINSVHVRKKELGMLNAIGMSGRQTVYMLQLEGLFYTAGTLALSLGVGSILGYAVYLWAKKNDIMAITDYRYPVIPVLLLGVIVLAVQLLITYFVNRNFKKLSLIDRIRFAD